MVESLRSTLFRYAVAFVAFAAVIGISLLLRYLEFQLNLTILIVVALVAVAWFGGRGPGLVFSLLVIGATMYLTPVAPDSSLSRSAFGYFSLLALLVFIVVLISGRKSVEQRLRRQSDFFRISLSSIGDAVIATDSEGAITFINPTAEKLTSCSAANAIGKPLGDIYKIADEETGRPLENVFETIRERDEIVSFEGNSYLSSREGGKIPINDTGASIIDSNGTFIGTVVVFQDVTERREAERDLIESEARAQQSQKLEAIGTLTGGVAHDFNNLLTAILGYTQLSIRRLKPDDPLRENLVTIEKAGTRGAELTQKLLAFSRRQRLDRRVINLNDSIGEILKLLERVIGENIKVTFTAIDDLNAVYADPAQIEQVIMNLSLNARDAMPKGGRLVIETRNVELDEFYCRQYPNCVPGTYAQILVSDTGTGMDAEIVGRVFEPFFTTKDVDKGTGLGLSMVYGIVKQHGGHLSVYSEPGRGTTFKVFLPVSGIGAEKDARVVQPSLLGGTETILVAEDEEALRNLSMEVLTALGYKVLSAENGEEAVKLFAAHRNEIDLLLFDVVMPVTGGPEAYQKIREIGGGKVPLIFMTGYSSEVIDNPYVKQNPAFDLGGVRVFQKPYTLDALGRIVRDVLDDSD